MKFAEEGFAAAGCPLSSADSVQSETNTAADKVVQLIKCVLALPLSGQDKLLLLRKSLQMKMLHWSRVACKPDMLGAISRVNKKILAGTLHIMKCSDAQVDTARISLSVRLVGLGVHLMSYCDGTVFDATYLAAALTHCAVSGGSEHFEPFKGTSGDQLDERRSALYSTVEPFMRGHWVDWVWCLLTLWWRMGYLGLRIRCFQSLQCGDRRS